MKAIFVCIACAVVALTSVVFPGAPCFPTLLKLAGVAFIAFCTLRKVIGRSVEAEYILLGAWTFVSVGLLVNVWYYTTCSGGSVSAPVLVNDDASLAWRRCLEALNGQISPRVSMTRSGYGSLLALLSWPGPPDIVSLLAFSELFVLLAIVFTGGIALRLSGSEAPAHVAPAAMLMIAMVSYFLQTGTILVKDACVCAVMASAMYAVAGLRDRVRGSDCVVLAVAILTGGLVRPNLMPLLGGGLLFFAAGMKRRCFAVTAMAVALCAGLYCINKITGSAPELLGEDTNTLVEIYSGKERLRSYNDVMGDYSSLPLWKMVLRLPVSLALQYITPLPWAFARDSVFGPANSWAHFSLPWYALGGLILYCMLFIIKQLPPPMMKMLIYGIGLWTVTALMTGGTISRYCLPWLPILVPAAAWAWQNGCRRYRTFKIWYVCYSAAMIVAIAAAFMILHRYNPGGWNAQ